MAIQQEEYWYDFQIGRYITQFMAIFQGLQVKTGKWQDKNEELISVEIRYAHTDRVVASILADNTQNKPIKLPAMSAYVSGLSLDMNRARGVGVERRNTYTPIGGLVPDDMKVIHQRMPVPYDLKIDLNIYASNTNQHFQILEQILSIFDPSIMIQTSDAPYDWTRLTTVTLTNVTIDTNYPIEHDRRIIQSRLEFEIPMELSIPANIRTDFIKRIQIRINELNNDTLSEVLNELDLQGLAI